MGWAGNCRASFLYFQIESLWAVGVLQGFGEGNEERECLASVAACSWSPRAGDGSLAMAQLVRAAAPSQSGVSQSSRGASYKAAPLMNQTPGRKMQPEPLSAGQQLECGEQCVHGAARPQPLPSLPTQAAEDVSRSFGCCVCCPRYFSNIISMSFLGQGAPQTTWRNAGL